MGDVGCRSSKGCVRRWHFAPCLMAPRHISRPALRRRLPTMAPTNTPTISMSPISAQSWIVWCSGFVLSGCSSMQPSLMRRNRLRAYRGKLSHAPRPDLARLRQHAHGPVGPRMTCAGCHRSSTPTSTHMVASRSTSTGALTSRERPHERHYGYTRNDGPNEHAL